MLREWSPYHTLSKQSINLGCQIRCLDALLKNPTKKQPTGYLILHLHNPSIIYINITMWFYNDYRNSLYSYMLYIQNTFIFFKYFLSISLKQKHQEMYEFCLFVQAGWRDGGAPGDTNYDVWILSVCSGWLTWWRRTRRY